MMIRAGKAEEANPNSGDWVFLDLGFSMNSRSCGLLVGSGEPRVLTFAESTEVLLRLASGGTVPMNLVIEAPLSVAFNASGNPTGRTIEKRDGQTRYWYVGLGCCVLTAATYLLRALVDASPSREIRLFEGIVSFKPKGVASSHSEDVMNLRAIIFHSDKVKGRVILPEELAMQRTDSIRSAFAVAGMDLGIPPVIAVTT